ncbi:MAG TPA: hypothetical protein VK619_17140 [Pyrinomonadaceae bacterium]|nr:hypothetical protein [Pyrinomonadaceae bacterium]
MPNKERVNAALALVLLASLTLACSALKSLTNNSRAEANKLVAQAEQDLAEVDRIADENDNKLSDISKAEDENKPDEVRRLLEESIKAIDDGIQHGENAAQKIEQASKLDLDPVYKQYLQLKAQAFRKQIEAFKRRRDAAQIMHDNYGKGGAAEDQAKTDFRKANDDFRKLLNEARDLHRQADALARQNPQKIGV